MQMDLPGAATGQAGEPAGWSALSQLGLTDGQGASPLSQLLTLTLVQVLERLVGAPAQPAQSAQSAGPSVPDGLPVAGRISQSFHPGHRAIDIAVPVGTPVRSTMGGRVVRAGWNTEGYGNLVIVENGSYRTYYAHLDSIPVAVGQAVSAGDVIGLSGNTGNSTGPHVHYEVRVNGAAVEPDAHV
jgi:murein DD-endopeptidase MepM/ murein hydrolase activator NlpD